MPKATKQRKIPGLRADPDEVREYLRSLEFHSSIDRERFVWVPGTTSGIDREQTHNGKTLAQTADELADQKLQFPLTRYFMPHWVNVTKTTRERKSPFLYLLTGNTLSPPLIKELALKLNTDCSANLGTGFVEGTGYKNMDIVDFIINPWLYGQFGFEGMEIRREPLLQTLEGFEILSTKHLNSQGLPISRVRKAYDGKSNFFFYPPVVGHTASFCAEPRVVDLICAEPWHSSDAKKGIFARAEGLIVYSKH